MGRLKEGELREVLFQEHVGLIIPVRVSGVDTGEQRGYFQPSVHVYIHPGTYRHTRCTYNIAHTSTCVRTYARSCIHANTCVPLGYTHGHGHTGAPFAIGTHIRVYSHTPLNTRMSSHSRVSTVADTGSREPYTTTHTEMDTHACTPPTHALTLTHTRTQGELGHLPSETLL